MAKSNRERQGAFKQLRLDKGLKRRAIYMHPSWLDDLPRLRKRYAKPKPERKSR